MIRTDVLIVGAGPTGLTLACDLARRGVDCLVVERAQELFIGSRGKGLQPRTLEVFDDLGVIDAVLEVGATFPPFRLYRGHDVLWERSLEEMLRLPAPTPSSAIPYVRPWLIPQWSTDRILFERLVSLGGRVEMAAEAINLAQEDDGVRVTIVRNGGEDTIFAQYVVGADGGRSRIRKLAGFSFEGETDASEHTFIGDVRVKGLTGEACHILTKDGEMSERFSFWNLPGSEHYQFVASMSLDEVPELSLHGVISMLAHRSGRADLVLDDLRWCSLYRTNVRMVDRLRIGRVLLAGDAAHVHSSAGGQGLNTGVQDAYNLGWKLARVLGEKPPHTLLDTYEEERLPVAAALLGFTSRLHKVGFGSTSSVPSIYQLDLSYRSSSIAFDDGSVSSTVHAGDRAPDAMLANGKRLFDVFRGPHFTLLCFGRREVPALPEVRTVHVDTMLDSYGIGEGFVLIRPDGYIGALSTSKSAVSDYFETVYGARDGAGNGDSRQSE